MKAPKAIEAGIPDHEVEKFVEMFRKLKGTWTDVQILGLDEKPMTSTQLAEHRKSERIKGENELRRLTKRALKEIRSPKDD